MATDVVGDGDGAGDCAGASDGDGDGDGRDGPSCVFSLVLRQEGSPPEKQGALEGGSAQPGGTGGRKAGQLLQPLLFQPSCAQCTIIGASQRGSQSLAAALLQRFLCTPSALVR